MELIYIIHNYNTDFLFQKLYILINVDKFFDSFISWLE